MQQRIYLDYNATAPLAEGLADRLQEWLKLDLRNPSSSHTEGRAARALIEKARKKHLELLGAEGAALVFTSGGTEANNMVLRSLAKSRAASKNRLLITGIEHSSVRRTAEDLEKQGILVTRFPVGHNGEFDVDAFVAELREDVFLISVMLANNETGFLLPVKELAEACRARGVPLHTDAVCAIGKIPVSFTELGVDILTFSAHKYGALKGTGGLIFHKDKVVEPILTGGSHESGKRAGTENVLGILASAGALEQGLGKTGLREAGLRALRAHFKQSLLKEIPQARIIESSQNLPQTLSIVFAGCTGSMLLAALDLAGVAASYGSACASGSLEPSPVLLAAGFSEDIASSAIRFSFGIQTTRQDIDTAVMRITNVIRGLNGELLIT